MKIDDIDKKLLRILQKDASLTTKQIAAEIGLTVTPVHERIKKLEKSGVILAYKARLDLNVLGKELLVFCQVSIKDHSKENLLHFEQKVLDLDEVVSCYHVSGKHDYMLKVVQSNMQEYRNFITNKLAKISNIDNVYSTFVMQEVKVDGIIKL